ncbi:MAG: VOC family protein [Methanobacterium sp.]|uniref:VOC family protein n=1 Tax=Methanobacterium sp. TaxID=2164 RepID=UPI003D655811|nr:VOC family protein [Methanobacterium sp.]
MEIKYICPLITVKDIKKSKEFYENVLKQEVEIDHGENVTFKGGFALHDIDHFQKLTLKPIKTTDSPKDFMELYFESEEIIELESILNSLNVKFVHNIKEQPWGQRVMRFYDLDGYIIEVGEPLEFVIKRFEAYGLSVEEISERTSMPVEFVQMVLE